MPSATLIMAICAIGGLIGALYAGLQLAKPAQPPLSASQPYLEYAAPPKTGQSIFVVLLAGFLVIAASSGVLLARRLPLFTSPTSSPHYAPGQRILLYTGHNDKVLSLAWSPDGKYIASADRAGVVRIWNAATGADLGSYNHNAMARFVAWSRDSRFLASTGNDGTVRVWDANKGAVIQTLVSPFKHLDSVTWSPDGQSLAAGSDYNAYGVNEEYLTAWYHFASDPAPTTKYIGNKVGDVEWSPDGARLAVATYYHSVLIFDAPTLQLLMTYSNHANFVYTASWSPDGAEIASGGQDGNVRDPYQAVSVHIWNANNGQDVRALPESGAIIAIAWSHDGKALVTGGAQGFADVWNVNEGSLLLTYRGHGGGWLNAAAWSPDNQRIATASDDGTVQIWQAPADV